MDKGLKEAQGAFLNSINLIIKKISLVAFLTALLFQNSISLLFGSLAISNLSFIFFAKETVIAIVIVLTLVSKKKYSITRPDLIAFLLFLCYSTQSFINFNGVPSLVFGFKYFIVPLLLYGIGRFWFQDIDGKSLFELFVVAIGSLLLISTAYFLIDKASLLDLNIWSVFESKGQDTQGVRFVDGFPLNFYSYYGGERVMRLFGPFFDPLATGFFVVPFLVFSKIRQLENNRLKWKLIHALLFVLLALTQTRGILLAYIAALFFIRFKNGEYKVVPLKWIFLSIFIFITVVAANYEILVKAVDPSTWGHLNAYYKITSELQDQSLLMLLIGSGIPDDLNVGNESLFMSMIVYNGVLYLFLFSYFIYSIFKNLSANANTTLRRLSLMSMIAYYLASFTTEHWFATTSSGLFWILLGMAINDGKKVCQISWQKQGDKLEGCNDLHPVRP